MPAIYTRTGDKGDTGLFGGSRVPKQSLRVEAYGTVDEANAAVGEAKAALGASSYADAPAWHQRLHHIQQRMFVLAAELASDEKGAAQLGNKISTDDITDLEHLIDECLAITGPQRSFVVPGRDVLSGGFHSARTVVRRAERRTLTLAEHEPVRPELIKYLNRLSDTVYAMARLTETWHDLAQVERVVRSIVAERFGTPDAQPHHGSPNPDAQPHHGSLRDARPAQGREMNSEGAGIVSKGAHRPTQTMTLDLAQRLAAAAEAHATQIGVPMVIAVADAAGDPVLLHRMPGSLLVSLESAPNKAWTASAFKNTTAAVGALAAEGGPFPGLGDGSAGPVVLFGGGAPILVDGVVIGALGISGGSAEEDVAVMNHAIDTVMGAQK